MRAHAAPFHPTPAARRPADSGRVAAFVLGRVAVWLAAAFLLVATLSGAPGLEFMVVLKYVRPALLLGAVAALLLARGWLDVGPVLLAMGAFVTFYWIAGLWSPFPAAGFAYKFNFVLAILAGVLVAQCVGRELSLEHVLRIFLFGAGSLVVFCIWQVAQGQALYAADRLTLFGMNANRTGEAAAVAGLISACLVAVGARARWRAAAWAVFLGAVVVILLTGSRTALGMLAIGMALAWIRLSPNPFILAGRAVILGTGLSLAMGAMHFLALDRFQETHLTGREQLWARAWERFLEAPLAGHGWATGSGVGVTGIPSTSNMHSMYFQILVETGTVGAALFLIGFLTLAWGANRFVRNRGPEVLACAAVGAGLAVGVLAYGVAESGPLTGALGSSLLLGLGIGLVDRIHPSPWRIRIWGGGASAGQRAGAQPLRTAPSTRVARRRYS